MKIITTLLAVLCGLFFAGLIVVICEDDARESKLYDCDEDGGFLDDWRLP